MAQDEDPTGPTATRPSTSAPFLYDAPPEVAVSCAALSHTGKVRRNNEDHYLIVRRSRSREILATNLPEGTLPPDEPEAYGYGVADGMGGAASGELASLLALRTAWDLGTADTKWTLKASASEFAELRAKARLYFQQIDRAIAAHARREPRASGMGTTLTVVYTIADAGLVFHTGDSRAYLFRNGALERLTRDHTVAQGMAEMGISAAAEFRNVLTSHLGGERDDLRVDEREFEIRDGDVLLLCTDGLTDMAPAPAIAGVLARTTDPHEACQALVDLALEHGGRDNVTVLIGRYAVAKRG